MAIKEIKFGNCGNDTVYEYILTNKNGFTAHILNYGGIIRKLIYKGVDVVLGNDTMEEYIVNEPYFGALIGRNSNNIENAEFEIDGKLFKLFPNSGKNNIHGGRVGFDKKIWDAKIVDEEEPSLILSTISPDGEEGFPGTVKIQVTYTLTNDNSLKLHYEGESDADTVLNMTNHAYFNLNGHASGSVNGHSLWLNSDFYTPGTDAGIPTGEVLSVKNTAFDFTTEDVIGKRLKAEDEQIRQYGGIDHNFVLNGYGYRKIGRCTGDKTGIVMEMYTDQKGVQIYSANAIGENYKGKDGVFYQIHHGICFETQAIPNSMRVPHFPSPILRKGEKYDTVTTYKFI